MSDRELPSPLLRAIEATAAEYRVPQSPLRPDVVYRPGHPRSPVGTGWYLRLPAWAIERSGGWDAFAEQFEQSWARTFELQHARVCGFEIDTGIPLVPTRRYTLKRFRDEETPE